MSILVLNSHKLYAIYIFIYLFIFKVIASNKFLFAFYFFIFYAFLLVFYFLNFKIFNSYMLSQTWTPLPPPFLWMLSFKYTFSFSSFTFIKRLFSSSLSAIRWYHLHIWGYWYFSWQSWFQFVLHLAQRFSWCILNIS